MPWIEKGTPAPFDAVPMSGRMDLLGDRVFAEYSVEHPRRNKYPVIHFPSGLLRELHATEDIPPEPMLHVFGGLYVPQKANRNAAYSDVLLQLENQPDYRVSIRGEDTLIVGHTRSKRGYILTYDNDAQEIRDVQFGWNPQERMDLLPDELRAVLPRLYANEEVGMEALAPLKFFTPDANWTWYPTEFDGEDTFFGLVSGYEVELGYFTLSELEEVRGGLALPIERDLYFTPTTLQALQEYHRRY
jgi:hypothetical protein